MEITLERTLPPIPVMEPPARTLPKPESIKSPEREAARIRWMLAINPNTPSPVLEQLANDNSPSTLERIAENPRTGCATLARLAHHSNPGVRAAAAENANLSPRTAWRLAHDTSADVRMRLAENYFISLEVLRKLGNDNNPYVQNRARKTIDRVLAQAGSFSPL
jgi:hypothetical protein